MTISVGAIELRTAQGASDAWLLPAGLDDDRPKPVMRWATGVRGSKAVPVQDALGDGPESPNTTIVLRSPSSPSSTKSVP